MRKVRIIRLGEGVLSKYAILFNSDVEIMNLNRTKEWVLDHVERSDVINVWDFLEKSQNGEEIKTLAGDNDNE